MKNEYLIPRVIAEIGCNHKGEMEIAKQLLKVAADSGVEVAKFQKRNNKELLTQEQYNTPHPNPINSYGDTYGAHREFLEFDLNQHKELKEYAESLGLIYSTSVWDSTSAKEIASINPDLIKVPSACNNHFEMLEVLRDEYQGEVHISFGMTTQDEEEEIVAFFEETNKAFSSPLFLEAKDRNFINILLIKNILLLITKRLKKFLIIFERFICIEILLNNSNWLD